MDQFLNSAPACTSLCVSQADVNSLSGNAHKVDSITQVNEQANSLRNTYQGLMMDLN
jgi:hypothetical protein